MRQGTGSNPLSLLTENSKCAGLESAGAGSARTGLLGCLPACHGRHLRLLYRVRLLSGYLAVLWLLLPLVST